MPIRKSILENQELSPIKNLEVAEISPIVKDGNLGKYVFLYDYQKEIFSPEAEQIMEQKGDGVPYNLPKESFYNLKYSKGDVVNVVDFRKFINDKGVTTIDKSGLVVNVPLYVKPIGGFKGFSPTITIDNQTSNFNNSSFNWLQKVPDNTPVSTKLGVNFGNNQRPDMKPVLDSPTTPVVTNGVQNTAETKSFFDDKNNLIIIAGVLILGYLLLNDKTE